MSSHVKSLGNGAAKKKKRSKQQAPAPSLSPLPTPQPSPPFRHTPEVEMEIEREREATVAALFSALPKPPPEVLSSIPPFQLIFPWGTTLESSTLPDLLHLIAKSCRTDFVDAIHCLGYQEIPAVPHPPTTNNVSVQTEAPTAIAKPTVSAATQTLPTPTRTYAEAAAQTVTPTQQHSHTQTAQTQPHSSPSKQVSPLKTSTTTRQPPKPTPLPKSNAVVIHGIRTDTPLPLTTRKVEMEIGREATGTRWLLPAVRRQKKESSIVMYFCEETSVPRFLYFGGRKHRVELYEWNRGSKG